MKWPPPGATGDDLPIHSIEPKDRTVTHIVLAFEAVHFAIRKFFSDCAAALNAARAKTGAVR